MKPSRIFSAARLSLPFATALVALLNLSAQSASATDLYWDSNDTTPGAGATPTGTWGTDLFWNTTPAGDVTAPTNVTTTGVDDLFFSAGTDAVNPFTVTVSGSQTARLLTFEEGTATLSGGTLITLAGGGGITTVGAGATTVSTALTLIGSNTFNVGSALNLSGILTGSITKTGSGTMTLGNGAAHSISGITVNQGTLVANTSSGDSLLSGLSATINSGGTLRWGAGGRFANNAGFTINAGGTLDINNQDDLVGSINGAGNVTGGSGRLQLAGGTSVFSGVISGTGMKLNLQSDAAATVTLSGLSTYTGTTTIERGTLNINSIGLVNGAASAVGTPTTGNGLIAMGSFGNSGTLVYTGTGHSTDRQIQIGAGGSGTGGAIIQADGASNAALVFSNGVFNLTAGAAGFRTLTLTGSSTGNNTIAGVIRANGGGVGVVKDGTGTWILGGANTYAGITNVNAGTLQVTGNLQSGTYGAALTIASGATFQYGGGGQTLNGVVGFGGGTLSKVGGADLILTNNGNAYGTLNISAGRVFINNNAGALSSVATVALTGGSLVFGTTGTYNNAITVSSGANISARAARSLSNVTLPGSGSVIFNNDDSVTSTLAITNNQTLSGTLSVQVGGGATPGVATLSGIISGASGAITKTGTGTLALSGANTYTGTTTVSAGLLSLGNALALQNSTLDTLNSIASSSATTGLQTTVTALTLGGLSGDKNFASLFNGGANGYNTLTALTLNPGSLATPSYSGNIGNGNGSMTLTKAGAGTQTLTGANTYTGATTVAAGTLALGASGSFDNSAIIVVGNAGSSSTVLDVTAKSSFSFGSGQTVKGIGTINIGSGKSVTIAGILAPGNSIGTINETGNLILTGTLQTELGTPGATPASGLSDRTAVTGNLTLTGSTLQLIDNSGADGNGSAGAGAYRIATHGGTLTGTFGTITNPLSATLHEKVVTGGGNVDLELYRLATGSTSAVNLGKTRVGGSLAGNLTTTNSATADGFSERLNATVGTNTGDVNASSGTVTGVIAGANASTINVGLSTTSSGAKTGSVLVSYVSDGTGLNNYTTTANGFQTVGVTGEVYDLASANLAQSAGPAISGSGPSYTLDFGSGLALSTLYTASFSIQNGVVVNSFIDTLSGGYGLTGAAEFGTSAANFSGLAAGAAANLFNITFFTNSAGSYTGTFTFDGTSVQPGLADVTVGDFSLALSANAIPEPSAAALLGGLGSLLLLRRRRA